MERKERLKAKASSSTPMPLWKSLLISSFLFSRRALFSPPASSYTQGGKGHSRQRGWTSQPWEAAAIALLSSGEQSPDSPLSSCDSTVIITSLSPYQSPSPAPG